MPAQDNLLPPEVLDALRRGQTIEAIKLLREATGLGLKEAKDAVDAHLRGDPVAGVAAPAPATAQLSASVSAALQRGDKIQAIKLLRAETGLGLKEAKDWIDAAPMPPRSKVDFGARDSSPGGKLIAWLVAAAVLAACAWFAWSRLG